MKLPPINITIERETVKRDRAARWLAKHDPNHKRPQRRRQKAGARR